MESVIEFADGTTATWDGSKWSGDVSSKVLAILNKGFGTDYKGGAGDHIHPPGVAAVVAAASVLGGKVTKCPQWPGPLPDGAVS